MPSDNPSPWKYGGGNIYERTWEFEYGEPMHVTVDYWRQLKEDPYFRTGMIDMEPGQIGTYINTEKKLGYRVFLQRKSDE